MGGFISGVVGFFSSIVTSVVNIVKAIFTLNFQALLFEPLRPICYLLGITDEDIVRGYTSLVRVFEKSEFMDTRTRLIAEKVRNDTGLLDMYWGYSYTGQNQYDRYLNYSKSDFLDYLPEGNIGSSGIEGSTVINALKADTGINTLAVERIDYGHLSNMLWAQWHFQENNGYDYASDILIANNKAYRIKSAVYNMDVNRIIVTFRTIPTVREVVIQRTVIDISHIDASNDRMVTTVSTETTKYTSTYEIISRTVHTDTPTIDTIPRGSESESETVETLSDTTVSVPNEEFTSYIMPPREVNYYQVVYRASSTDNKDTLWLCAVDDSRYNLSNPDKRIEYDIDLFPMVTLRNSKVDITDVNLESNTSVKFKKEGRYKQSKELLEQIGVPLDEIVEQYRNNDSIGDVYDVFFITGICPYQTMHNDKDVAEGIAFSKQAVAKLLYETVSYTYRCLPCVQKGQTYYMTFSEEPFKGGVYWAGVPVQTITGHKTEVNEAVMDTRNIAINTVNLRKITSFVKTETVYTDNDGYYYGSMYGTTYYIYSYQSYEVQVEGKVTGKSIAEALSGASSTGSGQIRLSSELDTLPEYQALLSSSYSNQYGYWYDDTSPSYPSYVQIDLNSTAEISSMYVKKTITVDSLVLDYQESPTEYRHIVLRDMHSLCFTDDVDAGLCAVNKVTQKDFFMPIPVKALEQLNLYDKSKLLSESFYLIFFAKVEQHLEFYETEAFASFLKIVGICIIIIVQIFTWWSGPSTSITLTAVLMAVLKMVVIAVALTLAIHLIQAFVPDSRLKMALTAVAYVAAMYFGGGFDEFNFSTAMQLVEIPCKMAEMYVGDEMKKLQQDYSEFIESSTKAMEQYNKDQAELSRGWETEDVVQLQSATRIAGLSNISIDNWFFLATNITPVDYLYDQFDQLYDYDSKYDLAF